MRILLSGLVVLTLLVPMVQAGAEERTTGDSARKAVEEYLTRIDEIDRIAAQQKAEAKARLTKALQGDLAATPSGPRYRGMLGSYFNQEGRIPFILLSVPNGENVFGDYARSVFNGKYDFNRPLVRYQARGHVVVPNDGQYRLEAGRGYADFKLNGKGYSLGEVVPDNRYGAKVTLKQGEYEVELSTNNNGGQLAYSAIRIVDEKTQEELPVYFYESELKAFRADLPGSGDVAETSKWTEEEQRLR